MTTEVEPPASGTLRKILIPEAETVPIVKVIGHILEPGGEVPQEWSIPEPVKEAVTPTPAVTPGKVLATSAAKRMAQERGVDLTQIEGTVERGAIIREDVLRFVEEDMPFRDRGLRLRRAENGAGYLGLPGLAGAHNAQCDSTSQDEADERELHRNTSFLFNRGGSGHEAGRVAREADSYHRAGNRGAIDLYR